VSLFYNRDIGAEPPQSARKVQSFVPLSPCAERPTKGQFFLFFPNITCLKVLANKTRIDKNMYVCMYLQKYMLKEAQLSPRDRVS